MCHYCSNRLGVRLEGPRPKFARLDGGEGGSHPSNVHDHVYAIGIIEPYPIFECEHSLDISIHAPYWPHTQHPPHLFIIFAGTINYTGDMPIALMVDGPSLGGFVCPATIVTTELWKMGQVRQVPFGGLAHKKLCCLSFLVLLYYCSCQLVFPYLDMKHASIYVPSPSMTTCRFAPGMRCDSNASRFRRPTQHD
jgi:hypothetical protein